MYGINICSDNLNEIIGGHKQNAVSNRSLFFKSTDVQHKKCEKHGAIIVYLLLWCFPVDSFVILHFQCSICFAVTHLLPKLLKTSNCILEILQNRNVIKSTLKTSSAVWHVSFESVHLKIVYFQVSILIK